MAEQEIKKNVPDISLVIPVYNEEESLPALYEQISNILTAAALTAELIFVDDGSTDKSFAIIQELHADDSRVRAIQLRRNLGKSAALSAGFAAVRAPVVITLDADLQDDPAEIPRFLEKLEAGADLVTGWKFPRQDPWSKRWPSKVINALTSFSTGQRIHDMNCGFKAYRREVTENLVLQGEQYRFIPAITAAMGFSVDEIKVHHRPRQFGTSKFGARRFFTGFFDLLTILFLTRYLNRPLHVFGLLGLIPFLVGTGIVVYLTILRLLYGSILHRHPLLIGGVMLVIMGIQFISTGLLAEMITFSNERGTKRPDRVRQRLD